MFENSELLFQIKTRKESNVNRHNLKYGENRYMCTKCGKRFESTANLKAHMQLHTGQFSYFCDTCRKGCNQLHAYQAHMMAHQGIKYQCEYCSSNSWTNRSTSTICPYTPVNIDSPAINVTKGSTWRKLLSSTLIHILNKIITGIL